MKIQGNDGESLAMKIILGSKDRSSIPGLSKKRWQQVAAMTYREFLVSEVGRIHLTALEDSAGQKSYSELRISWTRRICGALALRAQELGWDDLASQWSSRYWNRTSEVDDSEELGKAMSHIRDVETAVATAIADYPKRVKK